MAAISFIAVLALVISSGNPTPAILIPVALSVAAASIHPFLGSDDSLSLRPVRHRAETIRERIVETNLLLAEMERELSTRTASLTQMKRDNERYEKLAALNKQQVAAVEELLNHLFLRQHTRGLRAQWLFLVLAFVLGFVVNWLSTPILVWIKSLF